MKKKKLFLFFFSKIFSYLCEYLKKILGKNACAKNSFFFFLMSYFFIIFIFISARDNWATLYGFIFSKDSIYKDSLC